MNLANTDLNILNDGKMTRVCWSVWYYHPVWSGLGTPNNENEGQSHKFSYATPHEVITSYILPDKCCFAFISQCFKNQVDTKLFISLL